MRNYIENSRIVAFLKMVCGKFIFLKIYMHNSYIFRYIHNYKRTLKRYSQHTLLLKIGDKIYYQDASEFLNNSRFIGFLSFAYNSIKFKINPYLKRSASIGVLDNFREAFYFGPLKASSIILCCAVSTRLLLMVILNKKISSLDFIISIFILLLALVIRNSRAGWENLKTSSRFLKSKR